MREGPRITPYRSDMGDREDKVAKAREKLEKFRRNKNKEQQPAATAAVPLVDTAAAPTNSNVKLPAEHQAAAASESISVLQNQTAALEPELEKYSSSPQSSLPTSSTAQCADTVTVGDESEVSQSSNLSSYFSPNNADARATEGGSLSSYFQNQPSSESSSGIGDAFASLVSTIPSMDSISTNLVSTIQELVVEEPQEEEPHVEVEDIQQDIESQGEVSSSSVPAPAFYIGSEEGGISSSTNSPPVQASESMQMAAPSSSSSSLVQDARVAELIYLLEGEKRGREEEKRGREAEMRGREDERRGREAVEAEKAKLLKDLAGERIRLEEGAGLELQRLQGELAARSASIQLVVAERSDLEAALVEARRRAEVAEGELVGLRDRAERAEEEVVRQEERLRTEGGAAQHIQEMNEKREVEVASLRKEAEVREEESKEVHAKLAVVTISEATMRRELEEAKAELEMARVHLVQLRGGAGGGREGEVATLTTELQQVTSENMNVWSFHSCLSSD